jgi:hypothetical protein
MNLPKFIFFILYIIWATLLTYTLISLAIQVPLNRENISMWGVYTILIFGYFIPLRFYGGVGR